LNGFVEVCTVDDIPEKHAKVVSLADERVAVFRYDGKISAISNVCRHQNGPLGEGRIIDGCAPPPFTEKLSTFRVRLSHGVVEVDPRPLPPGTPASIRCG